MKNISSTVRYTVPHWNYCNIDHIDLDGQVPKQLCKFCVKTKDGYKCLLHDEALLADGGLVSKARACCRITAGFPDDINSVPPQPTVNPKQIIQYTIAEYTKQLNALLSQGYPRPLAEQLARQYVMGG